MEVQYALRNGIFVLNHFVIKTGCIGVLLLRDTIMNLDKSTKRIAKRVSKGFQGYPQISLAYFGISADLATEVVVSFTSEEGAVVQEQKFSCEGDVRKDETIQTTLLKVIERADAKTVLETAGISIIT